MIRHFMKIRPSLKLSIVLLWVFHFSFGMLYHFHPEYRHTHNGELQAHEHGGHFHSPGLEYLARYIDPADRPLLPGETHHHSESLPGSGPETAQYDFNKASILKLQLAPDFDPDFLPVGLAPELSERTPSLNHSSGNHRTLLLPQSHSERSPPLRI